MPAAAEATPTSSSATATPAPSTPPASSAGGAAEQAGSQNTPPASGTPPSTEPAKEGQGTDAQAASLLSIDAPQFTAPEGHKLDSEVTKVYSDAIKAAGLKTEGAQQILNAMLPALEQQRTRMHAQEVNGWAAITRADKELGGDNLPATIANAETVLRQFGDAKFTALMNRLGLGNNVDFLRLLSKVGAAIKPDPAFLVTSPEAEAVQKQVDSEQAMLDARYPTNKQKK